MWYADDYRVMLCRRIENGTGGRLVLPLVVVAQRDL